MGWIGAVIGWIIFGAVAGVIARMLHPGNDAMGMVPTILLGITGSLVGGAIAYIFRLGTSPYQPSFGASCRTRSGFVRPSRRR